MMMPGFLAVSINLWHDNWLNLQRNMKRLYLIIFAFIYSLACHGQSTDTVSEDTIHSIYHVLKEATFDGKTYPLVELKEIVVYGKMPRGVRFNYRRHARLVYNVRRVYPYAVIVRDEFGRINRLLETLPNDRARDDFLKQYQKELFDTYEGDIRKMTFTQGKILIKLIDRETQNTSYDLIREYRGNFSAFFWQGVARIFGSDLKSTYDPEGDDYLIEAVVREIEAGRL